ncbi:MAG: hypothetical protein NTZ68_00685 [Candidatus Dependentiae bacterium]|nr:hypothetical protein [Candidatus Dependentiae bacterium]
MFKFFFCALLFSTSFAYCSSLSDREISSSTLFRSLPGSPFSVASTQPPSPLTQRTRLLSGLEDRSLLNESGGVVTERNFQQTVAIDMPQDNRCHCVVNTENKYCRATLCFLGYLAAVGSVGAIVTVVVHVA